jgi:hypothetical protein
MLIRLMSALSKGANPLAEGVIDTEDYSHARVCTLQ